MPAVLIGKTQAFADDRDRVFVGPTEHLERRVASPHNPLRPEGVQNATDRGKRSP